MNQFSGYSKKDLGFIDRIRIIFITCPNCGEYTEKVKPYREFSLSVETYEC